MLHLKFCINEAIIERFLVDLIAINIDGIFDVWYDVLRLLKCRT